MKTKYEYGRLVLFPENLEEKRFCTDLIRRMTDSNLLIGRSGDVSFDDEELGGYIITYQLWMKGAVGPVEEELGGRDIAGE